MEHGGEEAVDANERTRLYALAVSKSTSGLIVSAGHNDNVVKIWK